ncbi:MAG TPA: ABC transporter permease [Vicinamibacterales bacterium]|nr:ABC transporter permease [Vicinamibacterales bacterium]
MQDLRHALRTLLKVPGFTTVAVLMLALGIGANTAIFSLVNAALLSPLPFPDGDRLVVVWTTVRRERVERRGTSFPDYIDLRRQARSFDALAAWSSDSFTLTPPGGPSEQVEGEIAAAAYFDILGCVPTLGRTYSRAEDDERGAHPVAVISDALWRRTFGADRGVIGRAVRLNDRPFTIVGVLPPGFVGLDGDTDVWIPMGMMAVSVPERLFEARGGRWMQMVARLRPGVSIDQATADVAAVAGQLEQTYADTNARYGAAAFSLRSDFVGNIRPALIVLLSAVGFVLLIACVNLANLLLARATVRQRETAIRAALGAGRWRLIRQFLVEGIVLSAAGAAGGLLLALWSLDAMIALSPATLPSYVHPVLDWRVAAYTGAATIVTALVLGLLPAWQGSRADVNGMLKEGGRAPSGGGVRLRLRASLVVAEIALSILLLIGAGLLVRSFLRLQNVDLGYRPAGVLAMNVAIPAKYSVERIPALADDLIADLRAVPGVAAAAIASDSPLGGSSSAFIVSPEQSEIGTPERGMRVYRHAITPGFFDVLGARLVAGRDFMRQDIAESPRVTIVSRKFAAVAWPGMDPVGRRFKFGRPDSDRPWITVVGVIEDMRYRSVPNDATRVPQDPDVYFPYAQDGPDRAAAVLIRATEDHGKTPATGDIASGMAASVRAAIQRFDRDLPMYDVQPLGDRVTQATAPYRFTATIMTMFGAAALLLAGVGVFGLINFSMTQRRHEIGLRMALGAGRPQVFAIVIRESLILAAAGVAIGVVAAIPASRALASQLYGIPPTDPATYASIAGLLVLVVILATAWPAYKASRVDPMVALRAD